MNDLVKVGLGGGCHWCTEGVFNSLKGVHHVEQGWIASTKPYDSWSEAVIVHFDPAVIRLSHIIEIHLHTHSSTSDHHLRSKYRSAIYYTAHNESLTIKSILKEFENTELKQLVTLPLPLSKFKMNKEEYLDYLYTNPESQFCIRYIHPKLMQLMKRYDASMDLDKLKHLGIVPIEDK